MKHFTIYDKAGNILRMGTVPDEDFEIQAQSGEIIEEGHAQPIGVPGTQRHSVDPPPPDFVAKRKAAYPRLEQQLDWLWHAMDRGELARVEPFYGQIAAVKSKFPKTIDTGDGAEHTMDL